MGRQRVTSRPKPEQRKAAVAANRSLNEDSENKTSFVASAAKRPVDDSVHRAALDKRKAAGAAEASLKEDSKKKKSSPASAASKRPGRDLVYSKKKLPLQKRLCIDKVGQDKQLSGKQRLDSPVNLCDSPVSLCDSPMSLCDSPVSLCDTDASPQVHDKVSTHLETVGDDSDDDLLQSSVGHDMMKFCATLHQKCSGRSNLQGEFLDWKTLGHGIGYGFSAIPSHCTFAGGRWDSHIIESAIQSVNSKNAPIEDEEIPSKAATLQEASVTEPVLEQADVSSTSNLAHEDQPSVVQAPAIELQARAIEQANETVAAHEDQPSVVQAPAIEPQAPAIEQANETVPVAPRMKLKKCFGDEKLFADLEKLHKYYTDWRLANPGRDVKDGSPEYINDPASMNTIIIIIHLEKRLRDIQCKFEASEELMQDYSKIYKDFGFDPAVPPIDHRLWTYREVVAHMVKRAEFPDRFYGRYYNIFGELSWRVNEIKNWLKKNRSRYPCLDGFDDGNTLGPSSEVASREVFKLPEIPNADYGDVLLFGTLQDLQKEFQRDRKTPGGGCA